MNVAELNEARQEEIVSFEMPVPKHGESVRWYRNGVVDARPPMIGFVIQIGNRCLRIQLPDGHIYESVPHVDDPRLSLGGDHRLDGAWDYTEAWYREQDMLARVAKIEQFLADEHDYVADKEPAPTNWKIMGELRKRYRELGLHEGLDYRTEFMKKSMTELRDEIAEAEKKAKK